MTFDTPAGEVTADADVVLGADGAGSAVRRQLVSAGLVTESVDMLGHGYKELTIPAAGGEFALDPGALHIWPRGTSMMIALPNPDRSFTCTLFWPAEAFAALTSSGGDPAALPAGVPRRRTADAGAGRRLPAQPGRGARHGARRELAARRPGRADRRCRACDRAVLRPGRELRVRGRGRAGPVPGRDRWQVAAGAAAVRAAPAGQHRGDRPDGAGELRRDAGQGGVAGLAARQARRAHAGTAAAGRLPVALRAGLVLHHAVRRGRAPGPTSAPGARRPGGPARLAAMASRRWLR